jgi:hypothetical protein
MIILIKNIPYLNFLAPIQQMRSEGLSRHIVRPTVDYRWFLVIELARLTPLTKVGIAVDKLAIAPSARYARELSNDTCKASYKHIRRMSLSIVLPQVHAWNWTRSTWDGKPPVWGSGHSVFCHEAARSPKHLQQAVLIHHHHKCTRAVLRMHKYRLINAVPELALTGRSVNCHASLRCSTAR